MKFYTLRILQLFLMFKSHEILYIKNFAVISYVIICNKYRKAGKAFRRARFLGLKLLDAKLVNNQPLSCEVRGGWSLIS